MPYVTLDQLQDRFGEQMLLELSDRANAGAIDISVVGRAQADADAAIDGHLAALYALPVVGDVPVQLVDIACAIVIYKLHLFEVSEKVKNDYAQALKDLGLIAKGAIKLSIAGAEPAAKPGSGVITNDRERPFTEENLGGFI